MAFTLKPVDLCVVTIIGKPWIRASQVCKALKCTAHVLNDNCTLENVNKKYRMISVTSAVTVVDCPNISQNYYIYMDEEVMYELLFSSQQLKSKDFRRRCCNVLFPHIRQQLTSKDHRLVITDRNNKIQDIQYESLDLQGEIRNVS